MAVLVFALTAAAVLMFFVCRAPTLSKPPMHSLAFLQDSYRAEVWYWGVVRLFLLLLIATAEVEFPNGGKGYVLTLSIILLVGGSAQAALRPWRFLVINWVDEATNILLVLAVVLGADNLEVDKRSSNDITAPLVLVCMINNIVCIIFGMVHLLRLRKLKRTPEKALPLSDAWLKLRANLGSCRADVICAAMHEIAVYDVYTLQERIGFVSVDGSAFRK